MAYTSYSPSTSNSRPQRRRRAASFASAHSPHLSPAILRLILYRPRLQKVWASWSLPISGLSIAFIFSACRSISLATSPPHGLSQFNSRYLRMSSPRSKINRCNYQFISQEHALLIRFKNINFVLVSEAWFLLISNAKFTTRYYTRRHLNVIAKLETTERNLFQLGVLM